MKRLLILVLVLLICTYASAEMPKLNPPDPRLDKKVTVDVNSAKLDDVAKSLSDQGGITIKAGSGERDWKVREAQVTIHAKDVALGKALDEVSRLLGFYVSREGKEGAWTYIIWQDKKARDLEAEMVTAEKEAAAKHIKDMRQTAIDNADKALKMSPDEAMKLKDKDPLTAYLGGTKSGRAFSQMLSSFGSQFPTEYDLMMRGKRSFIPVSSLPKGVVNDALNGGLAKGIQQQMGDKGKNLNPYQLVMMPMEDDNRMAGMLGVGGVMFITGLGPDGKQGNDMFGGGMPMTMFPIMSPSSGASKLIGEGMLAVEAGESMDEVGKRLGPKMQDPDFLSQAVAKDSPTEKAIPTDPELTREIELKADGLPGGQAGLNPLSNTGQENQGRALQEISRALDWQVYYESFNRAMPIALFVKPGKQPVYKVLIALEKAGYKWEHGESSLRIRPEDWAVKRSYAIPASYIAYYKDLLQKNGELTMDDVAGIANSLTDEQISNTLLTDPDLAPLGGALSGGPFAGSRDLLRVYASFDQNQKDALNTDSGLPFSQLSDAQWDKLNTIITDRLGGIYVASGSIGLKALTDAQAKAGTLTRTFTLTVQVQGEQDPRKIDQTIGLQSKKEREAMLAQRKKMQDQMKAAGQNNTAQPKPQTQAPQPAPASPAK